MSDVTSIHGIEIEQLPSFAQSPMPSGDTSDDFVLSMDPATGKLRFRKTALACGPSALDHNINIPGNVETPLWGPVGQYGMRSGLVAYVPNGVWNLEGILVVAGVTNVEYNIYVKQGHTLSTDPERAGIVSENSAVVGGGVGTQTGPGYLPFAIPFRARMIQFNGGEDQANEISISVFPKTTDNTGAALGLITPNSHGGGIPACFVSDFMITRVRGV